MITNKDILAKTAKTIINEITIDNSDRSRKNRDEVFSRITNVISRSERLSKNRLRAIICSATVVAVAICGVIYSTLLTSNSTIPNKSINYSEIAQILRQTESKEVTICVNNYTAIELQNNSRIDQTTQGKTKINEQTIEHIETDLEKITQVTVPKSKRAEVLLSDGTKVILNSDSRIIYATDFSSDTREIYIEGEAFLDVAKDNGKPFIVKTKKFTVNVTGTQFNVSAYEEDKIANVVLVKGSVNIDIGNKQKMYLEPGQIIQIDDNLSKIDNVDTYKYTCWIDNIMIFENQSLKEVAGKVSRFYNIDLVIDSAKSSMIINGKLDLKDNVEDVIKTLSMISNLKINQKSKSTILTN